MKGVLAGAVVEFPCPGIGICYSSVGLGRMIVKELDLKLALGKADRRKTESPHDEESWRGGQQFKSWSDSKSPSLGVWLFLVQWVTVPVGLHSDVKQRPNK